MPIGVVLIITFGIMAIRRGVDWPLALVAMALGDKSNGTILEEPVDMVGNLCDKIWDVAVAIFNGGTGKSTPPAALAHHAFQFAQAAGVVG